MERVIGLGGPFIKANDPKGLAVWYDLRAADRRSGHGGRAGLAPLGAVAIKLGDVRDGQVKAGGGELLVHPLQVGKRASGLIERTPGGVQAGPAGGEEFVERDGDAHGRSRENPAFGPSMGGVRGRIVGRKKRRSRVGLSG